MKQFMKLGAFMLSAVVLGVVLILFVGATTRNTQVPTISDQSTSTNTLSEQTRQPASPSVNTAGIKQNGTVLQPQPQVQRPIRP